MLGRISKVILLNNSYSKFNSKCLTKARTMVNNSEDCTDLVWMDMEMTGLDIEKDEIMEISCIITDKNLNILSEGPSIEIYQPQKVIDKMNSWCVKHHNESGLVEKCLKSKIPISKAEDMILAYLKDNIPKKKCPLAGNSIYMDRLFLRHYMPKVDDYLHYRIVDVSSIKELLKRWEPNILENAPKKKFAHRTLDDIKDSIKELRYYKQNFFNIS